MYSYVLDGLGYVVYYWYGTLAMLIPFIGFFHFLRRRTLGLLGMAMTAWNAPTLLFNFV